MFHKNTTNKVSQFQTWFSIKGTISNLMVSFRKALEHVARVVGRIIIIPVLFIQGLFLKELIKDRIHDGAQYVWICDMIDVTNSLAFTGTMLMR